MSHISANAYTMYVLCSESDYAIRVQFKNKVN